MRSAAVFSVARRADPHHPVNRSPAVPSTGASPCPDPPPAQCCVAATQHYKTLAVIALATGRGARHTHFYVERRSRSRGGRSSPCTERVLPVVGHRCASLARYLMSTSRLRHSQERRVSSMGLFNRDTVRFWLALGGVLGLTAVAQAQQANVTGRVTDQASGHPLGGARVTIVGTSLIAQTNAEGRYSIARVPAGQATVRASAVGYAAASRALTVNPGESAVADLTLALSPYSLDEVVVTSTGDQARKEVGNTIARIDAPKEVEKGTIQDLTDLLGAHAAGVDVLPGTQTGSPSRVRIRGTNSLSLNNEPIYVVDGIRIVSQNRSSSVCDVGCAPPSRVNDLSPDEIESIDVVKGPSASALYGTDAANGVIVITTKRGIPGRTRWTVYAEQGVITDNNTYPDAYRGWRNGSTPVNGTQCILTQTVRATTDPQYCVQDSVTKFNPFTDP